MAVNSRWAITPRLRLRRAFRRAALVRVTRISMRRRAPRPRTRMVAFGLKRAAPGDAVVGVVVLVLIVLAVEVVVGGTVPVAVVVPGRVGTVTPGRGRVVTTVVTQPTTGRQSCGAAGALLVNAPADKTPATRIPAPTTTRAAVASLWRGAIRTERGHGEPLLSFRGNRTGVNIGKWGLQQLPSEEAVRKKELYAGKMVKAPPILQGAAAPQDRPRGFFAASKRKGVDAP